MFYRSLTLCIWPDSEPTKLNYHPKQNLRRGGGPQTDKHLPQSLFTGQFFRYDIWNYFLPFFLRILPLDFQYFFRCGIFVGNPNNSTELTEKICSPHPAECIYKMCSYFSQVKSLYLNFSTKYQSRKKIMCLNPCWGSVPLTNGSDSFHQWL